MQSPPVKQSLSPKENEMKMMIAAAALALAAFAGPARAQDAEVSGRLMS
jgi:hypothetical protein